MIICLNTARVLNFVPCQVNNKFSVAIILVVQLQHFLSCVMVTLVTAPINKCSPTLRRMVVVAFRFVKLHFHSITVECYSFSMKRL